MDRQACILHAKEMLNNITPYYGNCGKLCDCFCCKGDDNNGMELLPGEFQASAMNNFGKLNEGIFVCNSECNRKNRPYSCMIYPLFPMTYEVDGKVSVKALFDIRAKNLCPLFGSKLKPEFYTYVRRSAMVLCRNSELKQYLIDKTKELEDYIYLNILLPSSRKFV